jgi:two-component system chemotaxis sensor kinase CheA
VNALHEQFIIEARELIQQASDDLIALEREGSTSERIERVFRAFHTLKGGAGVVELPAMSLTMHVAEDLLAAVNAGRLAASAAVIDQALACLDQVSQWVDAFEARGALPSDAMEDARATAERLRELIAGDMSEGTERSAGAGGAGLPAWVMPLIESQHDRIAQRLAEHPADLVAIAYEPRADCFFHGDDPLQLMRQVPALLAFRAEPHAPWPVLAELDPFACNLRLLAITGGPRTELANIFRLVPDQVRLIDVPSASLRLDLPQGGGADEGFVLIRAVIEEQSRVLRASGSGDDLVGRIGSAARAAANALRHGRRAEPAERIERAGAAAIEQREPSPLLDALGAALHEPPPAPPSDNGDAGAPDAERSASRWLRVHESKIDALVNMASELVVLKNGLAHLARQVEETGAHEIARAARREHDAIDRLAGDMHAAILQLRMVPVAQVFRSFPRLVRDMSQRLGKRVEFVARGETAECDKTIADRLFEPLLHLVRNALDHGIESREQRLAAGKPETATITLTATRTGDRLAVEVADDGGGIDPAMVRRRARERGLLPAGELDTLADEQVIDLIFSAGFSTALQVSDISGRGVGMDVVRNVVEQIGGRVSLTSRPGAGTVVRLDLPMTIAISRIMVVEAGGQLFGVPMDAVTETVRLTPDRISRIKGNEGFVLRDRVVPICSLAELMNMPAPASPRPEVRLLVVAEMGGKVAALEVDAICDRLDAVLKPMQGVLANARGYCGTTLLGDGSVLLVLNVKEII